MRIIALFVTETLLGASPQVRESHSECSASSIEIHAKQQLAEGNKALHENNPDYAFLCYQKACGLLATIPKSSKALSRVAVQQWRKVALELATQRLASGDQEGAKIVITPLLKYPYDAKAPPLRALAKKLHLLSPTQKENPHGEDTTFQEKATYEQEHLIHEVDQAWELPEQEDLLNEETTILQEPIKILGTEAIKNKLQHIIFPSVEFSETQFGDALDLLKQQSILFDTLEKDSHKKGVNIILQVEPINKQRILERRITVSLTELPLEDLLKYITQQAHLKIKIEPYAVVIIPEEESTETLITKEYQIPSYFFNRTPSQATPENGDNKLIHKKIERFSAKDFLLSQGITFPPGSSAYYLSNSSLLVVKNNQANLDLIDSLVEVALTAPITQVEIEARFVEVKQTDLQQLGCDWLLGAFQLPGTKNATAGGGTQGNQATYNSANYPLQVQGVPAGTIAGGPPGAGSVTAGNRLGSAALRANAIDTLLLGGAPMSTTGVLALAGVFTSPQFQVVLHALNQKKGVNLLCSPKVTVSSGHRALIKVAREFPYPAEYTPPQIPQNQGGNVNPVTPTTPSSFKTRPLGVELEVEPILSANGESIELMLSPQVTEFQGFVNYGNPIFSQAPIFPGIGQTNVTLGTSSVLLTENTINQPIFSVRQVDTQVTLHNGETVVLGGLLREDVQKTADKTPLVGNLPVVGSLFHTSSHQKTKRNLLIFVTVGLLDPSGKPIHSSIKAEE